MLDLIMILSLAAAAFAVAAGLARFCAWCGERRLAQLDSKYRAAALVAEANRTLGKKRADERDWKRAA